MTREAAVREVQWSEIDVCVVCGALVISTLREAHDQWHERIATEAIRSARRLDRIEERREQHR